MTRKEEIYKITSIISPDWCKGLDCRECYANKYYGCCQYIERAKRLYEYLHDKGYRNQNDLLKEFVESIEDRLALWIKDENYQANIAEAENDNLRKNTSLLMAETIGAIKDFMKSALEKFWEEHKDDK